MSSSNTRSIVSTVVAATAGVAGLYFYYEHRRLSRSTQHVYKLGVGKDLVDFIQQQQENDGNKQMQPISATVPADVFTAEQYFVAYDRAWRTVSKDNLPSDEDLNAVSDTGLNSYDQKLLTTYLRRNMTAFACYLPQAYLIKMVLRKKNPSAVQTFDLEFIRKLDFEAGDVVCGLYKVLRREDASVEFEVGLPDDEKTEPVSLSPSTSSKQGFDARMVIGIQSTTTATAATVTDCQGSVNVFSETIMWRDSSNKGVVMPLEGRITRVMHEFASWWLLESGVRYLKELRGMKD